MVNTFWTQSGGDEDEEKGEEWGLEERRPKLVLQEGGWRDVWGEGQRWLGLGEVQLEGLGRTGVREAGSGWGGPLEKSTE